MMNKQKNKTKKVETGNSLKSQPRTQENCMGIVTQNHA